MERYPNQMQSVRLVKTTTYTNLRPLQIIMSLRNKFEVLQRINTSSTHTPFSQAASINNFLRYSTLQPLSIKIILCMLLYWVAYEGGQPHFANKFKTTGQKELE